jgi:hypothetical protein
MRVAVVAVSTIVAGLSIGAIIVRVAAVSVVTTTGIVAMRFNNNVVAIRLMVRAVSLIHGIVRALNCTDLFVSHALVLIACSLMPILPNIRGSEAVSVAAVRIASVVRVLRAHVDGGLTVSVV